MKNTWLALSQLLYLTDLWKEVKSGHMAGKDSMCRVKDFSTQDCIF